MQYTCGYDSPLGRMLLAADEIGLTGAWFEGQRYFAQYPDKEHEEKEKLPILRDTRRWLDVYFSGKEPDFRLPLHFIGTAFQNRVWEILCTIPYGETVTYGEIARRLSSESVSNVAGRHVLQSANEQTKSRGKSAAGATEHEGKKTPCRQIQTANDRGKEPRMSAQAVGGAVGRNEISVIVPCHRVMGAGGNLTGYGGGLDKKIALLKLEGAYRESFFYPF